MTRALLVVALLSANVIAKQQRRRRPERRRQSRTDPHEGLRDPEADQAARHRARRRLTSTHAKHALWNRTASGWQRVGDEWPAVIGKAGAWGLGVSPAGREGPTKKEGDGKSPAGVFAFRSSYGYARRCAEGLEDGVRAERRSRVHRRRGQPSHYTEDHRSQAGGDGSGVRRTDEARRRRVRMGARRRPQPRRQGAGSCIFLHVWSGPESTTVGCTAMDKPKLEALLAQLDPANQPLYVLLPRGEYAAVAPAQGLSHSKRRPRFSMIWKTILVPHDFSSSANHALAIAPERSQSPRREAAAAARDRAAARDPVEHGDRAARPRRPRSAPRATTSSCPGRHRSDQHEGLRDQEGEKHLADLAARVGKHCVSSRRRSSARARPRMRSSSSRPSTAST